MTVIDNHSFDDLTQEEIDECDSLALQYLKLEKNELGCRKVLHNLQSVYYSEPNEYGGALIVCKDGNLLFADREIVSFNQLKSAFQEGLRSSKEHLRKRKERLND